MLLELGLPIFKLVIRFEQDVVTARQKTRRLAELLSFDSQDQARLATAVSELARNVYQYARQGTVEFFFHDLVIQALVIRVSDEGPGIPHIDEVLGGNYTSTTGMGVGLLGSKRLMDRFDIETASNEGTTVIIGKNFDKRMPKLTKADIGRITGQLISKASESPFEEIQTQNRELLDALEALRANREELAELNRELAETNRGVVALYAELDEKASSLQKANIIKTSFLSNMTHEFRTPLSSIISLTRILLQRLDGDLTEEQEKQVTYIQKSSQGLLELVSDLLDLAKVEAGKVSVNVTKFKIDEILGSLRGMFRPLVNEKPGVDLLIDWRGPEFQLETDEGKLSQILRNLISNAMKFTEAGTVSVLAYSKPDGVHFQVSDTGVGIPTEHLQSIFQDFGQVDSKLQRSQKGTGLGLPLSKKLARLLGGDIWVESSPGQGSTFHLKIPQVYFGEMERVLISQPEESASIEDTSDSSRFNVLIIDDDEASRYVIKSLVQAELDACFTETISGDLGLKMIQSSQPDLVFLDLSMPIMDGFEVLSKMTEDSSLENVPVIINSSRELSLDEIKKLAPNVKAVLSKDRSDPLLAVKSLRRALVKAGFDYKSM